METLIAQLVAGAVGGNAAGAGLKSSSMGTMLNTVVGLIGGAGGGQIMGLLSGGAAAVAGEAAAPGMDMGGLLGSAVWAIDANKPVWPMTGLSLNYLLLRWRRTTGIHRMSCNTHSIAREILSGIRFQY